MHNVVRRDATALRGAAISMTVIRIAVLLIRCARRLVWIPLVVRAVVTRSLLQSLGYRGATTVSRRDMAHGCSSR